MTQTVFEQLSKEMTAFAQNNHKNTKALQEFFLYELKLRCVPKKLLQELSQQIEPVPCQWCADETNNPSGYCNRCEEREIDKEVEK